MKIIKKNKNFNLKKTKINGLSIIMIKRKSDTRGYLDRLYCSKDLVNILHKKKIVQINRTLTKKKGFVRGLHYQRPPFQETKLVTCIKGKVYDLALDIRKNSKTFLNYHGEILSKKNKKIMVIPEGFAHGFQTLSKDCELLYFHTQFYSKKNEGGIRIDEPRLNIKLPKKISGMSKRDSNFIFKDKSFGLKK
jgi:dTDP-4-dehydrorhamnose 3,5-epimerase